DWYRALFDKMNSKRTALIAILLGGDMVAFSHQHIRLVPLRFDAVALARLGIVLIAVPVTQFVVRAFGPIVGALFEFPNDSQLSLLKNKRPQQLIGIVENLAFPWVLFDVEVKAASTAIAGWIALKALGK